MQIVASQKSDDEDNFLLIHVWFMPTLPSIISPWEIVHRYPTRFAAYSSYSNPSNNVGHVRLMAHDATSDIYLPGRTKNMLLWSLHIIPTPVTAGLRINPLAGTPISVI
jgi:hypothetical protein